MEVAGEVQVEQLHRNHLAVAAAGGAALDAEDRPERGLAQAHHRPLADAIEAVAETDDEFKERIEPIFREQLAAAKADGLLIPQVVYGYFPANGDGSDLVIWTDESRTEELARFPFPRQRKEPFLCIADFFRPLHPDEVGIEGSTPGALGDVDTLVDAMTTANDNSWHMDVAPFTSNSAGPGGSRYAYVAVGLRRSDGNSFWPGEYLSDSSPQGQSISDGTSIRHQGWYVAGRAAQSTTEYANNRLQLRNYRQFALKTDLTWETLGSTDVIITDASWHANFRSPGNEIYETIATGGGLGQIQSHSSGAGGGQSLGSIGVGDDGYQYPRRRKWALHGFPTNANKNRSDWRDNYIGLLCVMEARIIMHDPSGPDQRASNNVMIYMGGDWYAPGGAAGYINESWHGRLVIPGADWVEVCGHDIPSATLIANPPPGFS